MYPPWRGWLCERSIAGAGVGVGAGVGESEGVGERVGVAGRGVGEGVALGSEDSLSLPHAATSSRRRAKKRGTNRGIATIVYERGMDEVCRELSTFVIVLRLSRDVMSVERPHRDA
jgi:hypothetical protein